MLEEEDSIVEEIPVYLSKGLAQNLFVIQFPVKNCHYELDKDNIINCCVKPKANQVSDFNKLCTSWLKLISTHYFR